MRLYHRTDHAQAIRDGGFVDGEGYYLTAHVHCGVWVSDQPLDGNEGAFGDVLEIEVPEEVAVPFEWVEDGKGYREFLMPASILNTYDIAAVVHDPLS
jgi:hypothetical protein